MSRNAKIGLGAAAGVVLLLLVVGIYWHMAGTRPSSSEFRAFLTPRLQDQGFRITALQTRVVATNGTSARADLTMTVEAAEDRFVPIDAPAYLQKELGDEAPKLTQAAKLLASPAGPRLRQLAGTSNPPAALPAALLRTVVTAGARFTASSSVSARRESDGWTFELNTLRFEPTDPAGKRRTDLGSSTLVIDNVADAGRLKSMLAEQQRYADLIIAARAQYLTELQQRQAAWLAKLKPGALFAGVASHPNRNETQKVFLEISDLRTGPQSLSALLRNEGGWTEARRFQGTYQFEAEAEGISLKLHTGNQDVVRDAGPFLQENDSWQVAGTLTGSDLVLRTSDGWEFRLQALSAEEASAQRAEIEGEARHLVAATKAGTLYRGVAVSNDHSQSNSYHLRFTRQENGGAIIAATLEPTSRDDVRRLLKGTLVTNRFRSNGAPLRLESPGRGIGPDNVPLGQYNLGLAFRLDGANLVGEGNGYTYTFEPASAEYVDALNKARAAQSDRLITLTRPGTGYVGYARSANGEFAEKVALVFKRFEQRGALLEFTLTSLDVPGVYASMRGTLDLYSGEITASRTAGRCNDHLHLPLLSQNYGERQIRFTFGADSAEGATNDGFSITFPLTNSSPSAEISSADSGSAEATYPQIPGAYVWIEGAWKALPKNGSKVTYGATEVLNNVVGLLGALSGKQLSSADEKRPDKLADITFSGNEPVPVVNGVRIMIAYVGAVPPLPPDLVIKYPELNAYPPMEMALVKRGDDGVRRVPLYRIVPGIAGFRETRVPAAFSRVNGNVTLLTCTEPIGAGSYAVSVGEQAFELSVR